LIGLFPFVVFASGILAWVIAFKLTRIVSVASIAGAVVLFLSLFVLWLLHMAVTAQLVIGGALAAMLIWRHRSNIQRLLAGTEARFEKKR